MSSPTFFGDKPKGPTFGAKLAAAPISPPTVLRITDYELPVLASPVSTLGGI